MTIDSNLQLNVLIRSDVDFDNTEKQLKDLAGNKRIPYDSLEITPQQTLDHSPRIETDK